MMNVESMAAIHHFAFIISLLRASVVKAFVLVTQTKTS
jgi:hypothetical protein